MRTSRNSSSPEHKAKGAARDFPVVCVGGLAGGLDAYIRLLRHLPADMGVASVIVNHLRTVATLLHEILPQYTTMPVELITERLVIEPNHVFIIPAQHDLHVLVGEFRLKPISKPRGWPDVITVFLRSPTEHWDGKLIAVIDLAKGYCSKNPAISAAAVSTNRAAAQKVKPSQLSGRSAQPPRAHQIRQAARGVSKVVASATARGSPATTRTGNAA